MAEELSKASLDLRHAALLSLMTPEFKASVVGNVLEHRDKLPSDVRRKLDLAIKAVIRVPKFPYQPEKAPALLLKQAIVNQLGDSDPLANAVFESWFLSKETLYAITKGHLFTRDIEVDYPDFSSHEFQGAWTGDAWMSARDDILSVHNDLPVNDVALMLCFATDRIPSDPPADLQGERENMDESILNQARRYLELLPADAAEWFVDVPHFLTEVSEIADRKGVERESVAAARALNSQIAELDRYHDKLNYLELDTNSWKTTTDLLAVKVAEVSDLLQELVDRLQEYDPEPQKGSSLSETQRLMEEHDEASRVIQVLKGKIDQTMAVRPESTEGSRISELDEEIEDRDTETETAGGISDIKLSEGILEFDPFCTNYSLDVGNTVELLTVMPVTNRIDANINVSYETPDGDMIEASKMDGGEFLVSTLPVGQTIIYISDAFDDSNDSKIYMLSVTRGPESVGLLLP